MVKDRTENRTEDQTNVITEDRKSTLQDRPYYWTGQRTGQSKGQKMEYKTWPRTAQMTG